MRTRVELLEQMRQPNFHWVRRYRRHQDFFNIKEETEKGSLGEVLPNKYDILKEKILLALFLHKKKGAPTLFCFRAAPTLKSALERTPTL